MPIVAAAATSSADDFSRSFATPLPPSSVSTPPAPPPSPPLSAATETLRISEPQTVAQPPAQTGPVQDITLRIARPDAPAVDLHVTERAGELQVSVRTPDTALQTSLRQDLDTLTNSLERAGFRTETVIPRGEMSSQMDSREERQPQQEFSGRGGSSNSNGDSHPGDSSQGNSSDDASPGRRQQQQHNQRDQRPRGWFDELENTTT